MAAVPGGTWEGACGAEYLSRNCRCWSASLRGMSLGDQVRMGGVLPSWVLPGRNSGSVPAAPGTVPVCAGRRGLVGPGRKMQFGGALSAVGGRARIVRVHVSLVIAVYAARRACCMLP
jgi:hypothetical protein